MEIYTTVLIVGAGPSGLATSACLTSLSIPHIILEKEDSYASLWRKRAYDRLNLHLAKEFCSLPFKPHEKDTPKFMSKNTFVRYLEDYVLQFNINPRYYQFVQSASYDENEGKWRVESEDVLSGEIQVYVSEFLVIASGENSYGFIPEISGLEGFKGEVVHSGYYKSGRTYEGKDVLVVGCGNSGMEISFDLSNFGANTCIVVRNPFHVLKREMVHIGLVLLKFLPVTMVDTIVIWLAKYEYGDLSKYGLRRPTNIGPFQLKSLIGRTPVIDVGTVKKIKAGEIEVLPAIVKINGENVEFENGVKKRFDTIVFATGYKSKANKWIKDYKYIMNEDGMPKKRFPNHWKGEKKVYCAGLAGRGLAGASADSMAISDDIHKILSATKLQERGLNISPDQGVVSWLRNRIMHSG